MARVEKSPKPVDGKHGKSVKIIVGVAVALVLGAAVLYEIKRPPPNTHTASDRPTMSQKAADSTHMPERL